MKRVKSLVMCFCMLTTLFAGINAGTVRAADVATDCAAVRASWFNELTGGGGINSSDPDIAGKLSAISTDADTLYNAMNQSANRTYIFADYPAQYPTSNVTTTYACLKKIALATKTQGTSCYNNTTYINAVISALDWLYTNWYNQNFPLPTTQSSNFNWWDFEIGTPMNLGDIMILLYDNLSSTQKTNYCNAIYHFSPNPYENCNTIRTPGYTSTGANRVWKARVAIGRAIVAEDSASLSSCRDALTEQLVYVTSGDGFYADGSFIQHDNIAYNAGYGAAFMETYTFVYKMLSGTQWQITSNNSEFLYRWIYDSYETDIYRGRIFDNLNGREISRMARTSSPNAVYNAILTMIDCAPSLHASRLKSLVKYMATNDPQFKYYSNGGTPILKIARLKSIISDASVPVRGAANKFTPMNSEDRAFQLNGTRDYAFGISMFSSRIANYESVNYENLKGWHTGDGRTTLYNADIDQFDDNYWATVNMYRLPGITTNKPDGAEQYSPQIGKAVLTGAGSITDDLNDFTKVYYKSPSWALDSANASSMENDTSRAARRFDTIQNIIWHPNDMTSFYFKIYYMAKCGFTTSNFSVATSSDGVNWSTASVSIQNVAATANGWSKCEVVNSGALPANTDYIRFEIKTYRSTPGRGDKAFAGGTDMDGIYGVEGMDFHRTNKTLTAKKSWFMFDDEIVNLGAGISATDTMPVETTIENRKINSAGNNALTVSGTAKSTSLGWTESMTGVNWMHLAGNVAGSDIGYYFPTPANVEGLREARTGTWSDVSHTATTDATTPITRNYLTLYQNHGTNPTNGTYSYVLLPGMTSSQVSAYASSPEITVLANNTDVQAVKENTLGIIGANFWNNVSKTVDIITCDKSASVMTRDTNGCFEISVCDPTQLNTGTINIEVNKSISGGISFIDPGVTVVQQSPTLKLSINVNGAKGKSFKAKFFTTGLNKWDSKVDFTAATHSIQGTNTGTKTIEFDATPNSNYIDGVCGYADTSTTISNYTDMNFIVRMNPAGTFDSYDGAMGYRALTHVSYTKGNQYHVKIVVNLTTQKYDVWITPPGGSAVQIAQNFSYRPTAPAIDDIGKLCLKSTVDNSFTMSNHKIY